MPVAKKKPTPSESLVSTQESSTPVLPEQEEFRQYLRRLAVNAVQVLSRSSRVMGGLPTLKSISALEDTKPDAALFTQKNPHIG